MRAGEADATGSQRHQCTSLTRRRHRGAPAEDAARHGGGHLVCVDALCGVGVVAAGLYRKTNWILRATRNNSSWIACARTKPTKTKKKCVLEQTLHALLIEESLRRTRTLLSSHAPKTQRWFETHGILTQYTYSHNTHTYVAKARRPAERSLPARLHGRPERVQRAGNGGVVVVRLCVLVVCALRV